MTATHIDIDESREHTVGEKQVTEENIQLWSYFLKMFLKMYPRQYIKESNTHANTLKEQ